MNTGWIRSQHEESGEFHFTDHNRQSARNAPSCATLSKINDYVRLEGSGLEML